VQTIAPLHILAAEDPDRYPNANPNPRAITLRTLQFAVLNTAYTAAAKQGFREFTIYFG
jgi:hypothetical protein